MVYGFVGLTNIVEPYAISGRRDEVLGYHCFDDSGVFDWVLFA